MVNNIPIMLSIKDTANRFGVAQYHIRQLALSGKVKAIRAGTSKKNGKILVNAQSVAEYFNSAYITDETEQDGIKPVSVRL